MRLMYLVFAIVLSLSPLIASADSYEIDERTWQGSAIEELRVEGEPDEHGLVWMINNPRRAHEPWFAWVYNAGESPVFGVEATLEIHSRDKWFSPGIGSIGERVWPYQINPGSFGVVSLGTVSVSQSGWTDQRIKISDIELEHNQFWSLLTIEDFSASRGQVSGNLVNEGQRPLSQISARVACVEDGEITGIRWSKSDLMVLYPEESEPFKFDPKFDCDNEGWIYVGSGSAT